jgi:hypothetical protein
MAESQTASPTICGTIEEHCYGTQPAITCFVTSNLALGSTRVSAVVDKAAAAKCYLYSELCMSIILSQWCSSPQAFLGRMLLRFSKIWVMHCT